jgi:hypothetical protein
MTLSCQQAPSGLDSGGLWRLFVAVGSPFAMSALVKHRTIQSKASPLLKGYMLERGTSSAGPSGLGYALVGAQAADGVSCEITTGSPEKRLTGSETER